MRSRSALHQTKNLVFNGRPVLIFALALFMAVGVLLGFAAAKRFSAVSQFELRHYFSAFRSMYVSQSLSSGAVFHTFAAYLRSPFCIFLLCFSSAGLLFLPVLCLGQGFVFSFSYFCYLCAMGRRFFWLVTAMFSFRFLAVLPCTLYLCALTFNTSQLFALPGPGKRHVPCRSGLSYLPEFAVCCLILFLAAMLELYFVPRILSLPM